MYLFLGWAIFITFLLLAYAIVRYGFEKAITVDHWDSYDAERTRGILKKVRLWLRIWIIISTVLLTAFNSFYTVSEQEQALVLTLGRYTDTVGSGLHTKIPFIQWYHKVNVMTNGRTFGYISDENGEITVPGQALMITKDVNFVMTYLYIEWQVTDPYQFTYAAVDPIGIMEFTLQAETKRIVGTYDVDDALTSSKSEIQAKIREAVKQKIDEYEIGISIQNLSIQDIEPPVSSVINAFMDVENARQAKDTELNKAKAYSNQIIPDARAKADEIVKSAEAKKEARIQEANGQIARFNELYSEYAKNPDITRTRLYFETMEYVLPRMTVFFENGDNILKTLQLDGRNTGEE